MAQHITIRAKKSSLITILVAGILVGLFYVAPTDGLLGAHDHDDHAHDHTDTQTVSGEMTLQDRFEVLRTKSTNACGAQPQHLDNIPDGKRMQGSCCAAMKFHSYEEQITGLNKHYADYDIIPSDPYNVSVKWAKRMIGYNEATELTEEQRAVYDEATELSHEGGPCCCKCWHWYAYAGLGKKLIIEHGFTAEQVAQVWDFSDACGGSHSHA